MHQEHEEHASRRGDAQHDHSQTVCYGLMALLGIIGFLAFERILTIVSDLCSKSHGKTTKVRRRVLQTRSLLLHVATCCS